MMEHKSRKIHFQSAIRQSIERLVSSGAEITASAVINEAKFADGRSVGKTTLYSRHEVTGELVHSELLKEISAAQDFIKKRLSKPTRRETISGIRKELVALREENCKLVDQVVGQEFKLREFALNNSGDNHIRAELESQIYVLSSLVHFLSNGALKNVTTTKTRFEEKYSRDKRLELASREIELYLEAIKNSRLIGLHGWTLPEK